MNREKTGNHRPDWRITIAGLEEPLEITNAHAEGHARSIALDYLQRTGRPNYQPSDILQVEKLSTDLGRHKERVAEAAQGTRVLPPTTERTHPIHHPHARQE